MMMKKTLLLVLLFLPLMASATVVRMETPLGAVDIQLFDDEAPITVANFLAYIENGDYAQSFVHRSVPGFVIQGGGYVFRNSQAAVVPAMDPIVNEFGRSNTRGTIAMAKFPGDPNSATSEWFINLADNSNDLDTQNGGFTVFGEVLGNGMDIIDAIAALQVWNAGSPFTDLPLINFPGSGNITEVHLVFTEISVLEKNGIPFTPGLNGSWFNPATSGQGFFIDVFPDISLVFFAWFTYDTTQPDGATVAVVGHPGHRWLTASGNFDGNTVVLDVTLTTGGIFDNSAPATNSPAGSYGTITLHFEDCVTGTMTYDFPGLGLSGTVPMTRIAADNVPLCESLVAEAQAQTR